MTDFDVNKAKTELMVAGPSRRGQTGPKLTLASKCAALASMYQGAPPWVVAIAFGVSETTASYIAGCITDLRPAVTVELPDGDGNMKTHLIGDPNISRLRRAGRQERYRDVLAEYERLGMEEFIRAYYTADIHERVMNAMRQPRPKRDTWLPNPKADKAKGPHHLYRKSITVRFLRLNGRPVGWAYSPCDENGEKPNDGWWWSGREIDPTKEDLEPFRTSEAALAHAIEQLGQEFASQAEADAFDQEEAKKFRDAQKGIDRDQS